MNTGHQHERGAYDASYYLGRERWRDRRTEARLLLDLARVTAGCSTLDIGCGAGLLLHLIGERGGIAVGTEVNATAILMASKRAPTARLVAVDPEPSLPFAQATFSAVVNQHVIEHLDTPAVYLQEWCRVLKPGGRLALVTPNARYRDPDHFADADHKYIWQRADILRALRDAGLTDVRAWTIFPYVGKTRLTRSMSVRFGAIVSHLPVLGDSGRTLVAVGTMPASEKARSAQKA